MIVIKDKTEIKKGRSSEEIENERKQRDEKGRELQAEGKKEKNKE
jgi:hypothetical protein